MLKNHNTCCVLFYDNTKYDELANLAYNSFVNFHKNEVDTKFITPSGKPASFIIFMNKLAE